ncbi:MAG TPA: ABC transporter ATP-binding protein [Myxococcota bacterium]|nr:ABC transporter ATP-binding protein [Myxococcota bacterium]
MTTTPRSEAGLWRGLWGFLRRDLALWGLALLLAPATAVSVVLQPWLLKSVIDEHIVTGDLDGIRVAALTYLAAVLAGFCFQVGHTAALSIAATRTIGHVRRAVFEHLVTLPAAFFDREPSGRLLTRATSDVEALSETLNAGAFTLLLDLLQVIGVLAAMVRLDPWLTLTLLLVAPPLVLIIELLRRRLRALFGEIQTSQSALNAWISERLEGLETVQLHADEGRAIAGFDDRLARYRDASIRSNLYDALMYASVDGIGVAATALILWYGSGGALSGVITAGVLAAFIDYLGKLIGPIQEFSQKIAVLQRASAALEKIFSLLDVDEAIPPGEPARAPLQGDVVLRDVGFAYPGGPPVLEGVDLVVHPREVLALCGRTGSGKTTLSAVLTRSYVGYTGSIRLDGHELSTLDPKVVRRAIGTVRQDVQLFPDTVRFNLTLGHPFDDAQILAAARAMRAERVVERLGGLDGHIAAGGKNLSSGEAQLLALARVTLHDPPIVLLDEATASVDPATEARVQEAIDELLSRKTVIVIAHRLGTILRATRVAVMDAGRVVEVGTHAELMARGEVYARLVQQRADATEGCNPG